MSGRGTDLETVQGTEEARQLQAGFRRRPSVLASQSSSQTRKAQGASSAPSKPLLKGGTGSLLLSRGPAAPLSASGLRYPSSCSALGRHLLLPPPGADPSLEGCTECTWVGAHADTRSGNSVISGSPSAETVASAKPTLIALWAGRGSSATCPLDALVFTSL